MFAGDPVGPSVPRLRRTSPMVVLLIAVTTAAALAVSGLSTWAVWQIPAGATTVVGHPSGPADAATSLAVARGAAETAILSRRASAVLHHDRGGFLADLDPENPGLRSRQSAIFTGLIALPLSRFSYRETGQDLDRISISGRYDAPVHVAAVLSTYELAGMDTGPVVEPMGITFVQRSGRWWYASDRDADKYLPAGGHAQPWDDGQVAVAKGHRCLVVGASSAKATLARVAVKVDAAIASDLRFWPAGHGHGQWSGRVVVYVPRTKAEFAAWFRGSGPPTDVVAIEVPVYAKVMFDRYGEGYGSRTGARVVINPSYFHPSTAYFSTTLRHEVSHVAAQPITSNDTPSWFVEGLAEYVAYRTGSPAQVFFARGVDPSTARRINAHTYRVRLPNSSGFYSGSTARVEAEYTTGFFVCAYIQHRYGEGKLHAFAIAVGRARSEKQTAAVQKAALKKTFGLTASQLEAATTSWLRGFQLR